MEPVFKVSIIHDFVIMFLQNEQNSGNKLKSNTNIKLNTTYFVFNFIKRLDELAHFFFHA